MTTIAMGSGGQLSAKIMESLHEFRKQVFVRRLGWSLPMLDGTERDQYDTPSAMYLVVSDETGRVTACARLLPTTGSYMLPELFPQLLHGQAAPEDSKVWELSRFATSVRQTKKGRILSLSEPTLELLNHVIDFARQSGVLRLVLITSIGIERLMLRAGLAAHRLGPPAAVNGMLCVALFIEVPAEGDVGRMN